MLFTLIRPAATFSLMEKESNRTRFAKRLGNGARASWSAAVFAAFLSDPKRCREPHSTTLPRLAISLSQRERVGERESA